MPSLYLNWHVTNFMKRGSSINYRRLLAIVEVAGAHRNVPSRAGLHAAHAAPEHLHAAQPKSIRLPRLFRREVT